MATKGMRICVYGSGNGAQTAAGLLAARGHTVTIIFGERYADRADALRAALAANAGAIALNMHNADGTTTHMEGPIASVTTDVAAAVPSADIVIVSLNGPAMGPALAALAPHLRPHQLLLLLQGLGGVNYAQLAAAMPAGAPLPIYAAAKILPWATRLLGPGRVNLGGAKAEVGLAVAPDASPLLRAMLPALVSSLLAPCKFILEDNPLDFTYLPYAILLNPVIHPGMMYGTWLEWDGIPLPEKPLFYHTASHAAVAAMEGLQSDSQAVIAAFSKLAGLAKPYPVKDMHTMLADCYGDQIADSSSYYSLLRTNAAYAGIYHPMKPAPGGAPGWVPDWNSRLLSEDVPCGLVAIKGVADILGVATPWIDRVVTWAQAKLGKEYIVGGRLCGRDVATSDAPQRFGVTTAAGLIITAPKAKAAAAPAAAAAAPASLVAPCGRRVVSFTRQPSCGDQLRAEARAASDAAPLLSRHNSLGVPATLLSS